MSLDELFSTLEQVGIRLSASDGQLNFRAPKGAMTTELKAQIRDSKADILRFFSEQESILPIEAADYYALCHAQQRIWMLAQIEQDGTLFNVPLAYVIEGEFDVARFKKSLACLLERHEILRTVFPLIEGEPKQRVTSFSTEFLDAIFSERDVQDLSPSEIENLLTKETRTIFDLEAGPMFKVLIAKESSERQLLLVTLHHIVTDGWSVRLMMQELIAHYKIDQDGDSVLPNLSFQYRDFAAWQNRQIQSGAMAAHQKFWIEQFSEGIPTLELHTDFPRPAVQSFNGAEISFSFDAGLVEAIHQLSRRCSASFYMTLVTLTQTLLLRHSQQESIVVGMPVSGRERSDLDDQLGLYINTMALKTDLPMSLTAIEAIEVVRNNFINAYEYQAYPFDLLVDDLDLDRDLSRSPLFDVMVILQESGATGDSESTLRLSPLPMPSTTSKYDLTFHLEERASELHLSIEYNTDLFSASRIKGLGEQFGDLAKRMVASPDVPLSTFSVLSEMKEGLLLSQLTGNVNNGLYSSSDADSNLESDRNFIASFREQAAKNPRKTAITFSNEMLTYEQLDQQSDSLAAYLQNYFQHNSIELSQCLVGLCVERSTRMIVSLLGVLKSGAAYLPIDPGYPSDRIAYMLKDSGAQLVLSEAELVKVIAQACDANFVCIDSQWESICRTDVSKLERAMDNENLAYVIYTSGSTGLPKGVEISHHALSNFLSSMAREPGLRQQDRLLAVTTICFDIAALELFLPLLQGAEIVLAADSDVVDGQKLIDLVGQHQVTCMQATPVTWKLMLSAGWQGSPRLKVLCGGEALSTQLAGELLPRCDQLWNMYGPTETTIWSLVARITSDSIAQSNGGIVHIGSPIENTTLLVLDRWGKISAPGVPGELCIGGAGLARGYLNRPDLSADKFFLYGLPQNQPLKSQVQENSLQLHSLQLHSLQQHRYYRTGDLVCVTEQGQLDFLGRLDNQVKVRGYRIELGEIEAQLGHSDLVSTAVVCAQRDSDGQNYLVAYIQPTSDQLQIDSTKLLSIKAGLSDVLPGYMVPDQFVVLDEFPLTANGKIDRKKLLQHDSEVGIAIVTQSVPYVPADTPLEKVLVDIWQSVLEVETVGLDDNFFELGGHSLKATRLVFRLQKETELALQLLDIFKYPTISKLIENVTGHESIVPIEALTKAAASDENGESLWPLSRAQERLWLMHQLDLSLANANAGAAYNVSTGITLSGPLDIASLQLALTQIIKRHESLRTVFPAQNDGSTMQRVVGYSDLDDSLAFIALQGEQDLTGVVTDFTGQPFDLVHGPLFKVLLVKADEDLEGGKKNQEHTLVLSLHHIICDEWSLRIILQELLMLYHSHSGQSEFALKDLAIQYRDYAHWQNRRFADQSLQQLRGYWLAKISAPPGSLNLPADYPRPDEMDYQGDSVEFNWPLELNSALAALAVRAGQSQFMILTALVKVLLFRYSGETDITIGSPVLGRTHPDLENQVGNYVNMLALRDILSPHESFLVFLDQIKETISGALEHQEYPFDQLVEDLSVPRELDRHPVFDVLISLESQSVDDRLISLPVGKRSIGLQKTTPRISPYSCALPVAKYDLSFNFTETEEGLRASINFRTSLFKRQRIERLAGHLVQLMHSIIRQPETPLRELSLLTEAESQALLSYNQTAADYPKNFSLVDLWSAQVLKNPNTVAVIYRDIQMTYQEIDEAASRLATMLITQGEIGLAEPVVVYLEKSHKVIISFLGVLKAGGCYVPLDPSYPEKRADYILQSSHCRLIIADDIPEFMHSPGRKFFLAIAPSGQSINSGSSVKEEFVERECDPNQTAYVIYTSGSTGQPKGCKVSHCNVVRFIVNDKNIFNFSETDVWLVSHSFSFDFSVLEMYGALLVGGRVVVADREDVVDTSAFRKLLCKHQVTILTQTPAAFTNLVLVEMTVADHGLDEHLRMVILGGERLSFASLQPWISFYPNDKVQIINGYGPTEATVLSTYHALTDAEIMADNGLSIIGGPLPETQVYIFDEFRQQQPIGISGEIWIGGSGVCQGYINQPTLTSSRFVPMAVASGLIGVEEITQLLYRSGDVGSRLEDGSIVFLGRNDNQVQVRGFRIELGEIEAQLNQFSEVEKSFVTVNSQIGETKGTADSTDLVAYIVPANKQFTEGLLRTYLGEQLPVYMVPTFIVMLEELPLTSNGKIDTAALPIPGYPTTALSDGLTRALTKEHGVLAKLWSQVLGHNVGSATDNFFDIGGQSLKAVQLSLLIEREYQKTFNLRNIFSAPTIEQQCELIRTAPPSSAVMQSVSHIPMLDSEPGESEVMPLSPTQRRLWALEELGLASGVYNIYGANVLIGDLNAVALEQAVNKVIQRHSVLRTVFVSENATGGQKIRPFVDSSNLDAIDLASCVEAEKQVRLFCQEDAVAPFDLSAGPLYRFKLYKLDRQRHVFSINLHHLISDGWSQSVLVTDLMSCYEDFCQERSSSLNKLELQYYDYACWINRLSEAGKFDGHKVWWRQQFVEDILPLTLPSDRSRPSIQEFSGDIVHFELPETLSKLIRRTALNEQQSVYAVLLTAVKVLLHRYSGQKDIIVGSAEAGRSDLNLSEQIGFYANMLVLRDQVESNDCWQGLLCKVGHTLLEALEHRDYPFDELVEDLAIPRDISRSPLFDVAVSMLPSASLSREQASYLSQSIDIQPFVVSQPVSRFDLSFYFTDSVEGAINGGIEFSTALFDRSRIERMAGHFTQALESGLNNLGQSISDLRLLTDLEIEEIKNGFSKEPSKITEADLVYSRLDESPSSLGPVEIFLQQVKINPQGIAVQSHTDSLSYQQLDEQSAVLAAWLMKMVFTDNDQSSSETPEKTVALLFTRHPRMVVSVLAVLRAGLTYVPLDSTFPESRLSFILDDSDSTIVLTEFSQRELVPSNYRGLICAVDSEWASISEIASEMPSLSIQQYYSPQRLAYIIYTSGSTGQPKGVLIEGGSIVDLVKNTNFIDITPQDRILQAGSLAFDASTFEIWGAILNGASLYMPSRNELLDPATFANSLYVQSISITFLTTSLFNQLSAFDASLFSTLRVLMTGGEKVSLSHVNSVQQACPDVELLHVYGPTENTTFSTYYCVTQMQLGDVPIGYPVTGSTLYILDQQLQLCPIGVPGEIYLGGGGLARGYLRRDDLTRDSFIERPASLAPILEQNSETPTRLYRTGDTAVWLEDGAVQYTGRIDNQVKIRGFRVEPEELELHLKALSSVAEAAVKARQTTAGTWELVAWIVWMSDNNEQRSESMQIDLQQINDEIALSLPAYMLPAAWGILDTMPMKSTGKIDREKLPKPEFILSRRVNELVTAKSASESLLLGIWKTVLGFSEIGITDNFFELGGDSIKVIQVISRLRKKGFTLEARRLYEEPTIIAVAPYLIADKEKVNKGPVTGLVRLSPIQAWFFEHFQGPISHFNQSVLLVCKDRIDIDVLTAVIEHLQTLHDSLRMQYLSQPDGSYQQVCQPIDFPVALDVVEIEKDSAEVALVEMNRLQASINLQSGPLFKVLLIRSDIEDRVFVVTHHLVVDGVSWRLLLEELEALYTSLATHGEELPVIHRSDSYRDWTEWLYHFSQSDDIEAACDYWNSIDQRDDFADYVLTSKAKMAEEKSEATSRKEIAGSHGGEQTIAIQLNTTKTQQLVLESGRAYHTDVQDLLLAAFSLALYRWQELQSVMITLEGHGRESLSDSPMIDSTIGWFTCLYPHQLYFFDDKSLSLDQSFAVLIKSTKESIRKIPNKGLSYGIIQQYPLAGREIVKPPPLISFNYLGQFDQFDDVPDAGFFTFGENASTNIDPDLTMPHAVDFNAIINNKQLVISLSYQVELFDAVNMQSLLNHVEVSLGEILYHCLEKESSENTVSDFEFADLDEDDFDSVLNNL
jgi:tyrocidine synthetase-3